MSKISISSQYKFLFKPRRYKIMYSGRMAGKSWNIALSLLTMGLNKKLRILAAREFQNSITDSVHKLLSDMNSKYNMGYEVTQNSITHPLTGTQFLFHGLKTNITKIKSLEGIDICWVEEAETVSQDSLDVLLPTIRKEGSELWFSFNPAQPSDAVYKTFVVPHLLELARTGEYIDQTTHILKTHYSENQFLSETALIEINRLKDSDYESYRHVYGGEPVADSQLSIIKAKWVDAAIDAHLKLNFKPRGIKSIGFDPADMGDDFKAYSYRHGSVILALEEWSDGDLELACEKVFNDGIEFRAQHIIYDVCGLGVGARIKFKQLDPDGIFCFTAFNGAGTPDYAKIKYMGDQSNSDVFKNKRAQYYTELATRFENTYKAVFKGAYIDPDEMISISSQCENIEKLKQELTSIRRKSGLGNSFIQIESKPDMKKRGIPSQNLADSLSYALATPPRIKSQSCTQILYRSEWS